MDQITLTPTQHFVLAHAVQNHAGKVLKFPKQVNGGAHAGPLVPGDPFRHPGAS